MNRFIIWVNKFRYAYFYKSQPSRKKIKHRDGRSSFTSSSKPISMQVSSLSTVEKSVGGRALENFLQLSALAYKHTASLCAFMFIQIFASGKSRLKYSLCKFNLRGVTSNRRLFCVRAGRVCQSAASYGLIGILSKHKGMMGELWSKQLCPLHFAFFSFLIHIHYFIRILMHLCGLNRNSLKLILCPMYFSFFLMYTSAALHPHIFLSCLSQSV